MLTMLVCGLVVGGYIFSVGVAKGIMDKRGWSNIGWEGAMIWPFVFAFYGGAKVMQKGYQLGSNLADMPGIALPAPPTAEALTSRETVEVNRSGSAALVVVRK